MVTPTSTPTQDPQTSSPTDQRQSPRFRRLSLISHLLDNAIPIPGTGYRFGLDPILGLIPAVGDSLGAILSVVIIWESAQLGASHPTLIRMILNVFFEVIVGIVPVLGDLFDVAWKANARNLTLLEQEIDSPQTSRRVNQFFLILLLAGALLILLVLISLPFLVLSALFSRLFGG